MMFGRGALDNTSIPNGIEHNKHPSCSNEGPSIAQQIATKFTQITHWSTKKGGLLSYLTTFGREALDNTSIPNAIQHNKHPSCSNRMSLNCQKSTTQLLRSLTGPQRKEGLLSYLTMCGKGAWGPVPYPHIIQYNKHPSLSSRMNEASLENYNRQICSRTTLKRQRTVAQSSGLPPGQGLKSRTQRVCDGNYSMSPCR